MPYLCSENKNAEAMKPKTKSTVLLTLIWITLISFWIAMISFFIFMIWGLYFWPTIMGILAAVIGGVSFSIAVALGIPESKGLNSSWRDDGLG